jgi:DNA-binding NtrC family response regulator
MFRGRTSSTILVVDDEEGVTQIFARLLRREGYEVCTALSAEAGLQAVEDCRPDAIILDLRMPLVDGVEFLRRLRTRDTHTPVVVVTGDYSFNIEAVSRELQALDASLIFKPVGRNDLIALARRLTSSGEKGGV